MTETDTLDRRMREMYGLMKEFCGVMAKAALLEHQLASIISRSQELSDEIRIADDTGEDGYCTMKVQRDLYPIVIQSRELYLTLKEFCSVVWGNPDDGEDMPLDTYHLEYVAEKAGKLLEVIDRDREDARIRL
mgnify:CR=1 FL=1